MKGRALGLRARFLAASVLLVLTTVAADVWTLAVLSRLASVAATTVHDTDEATTTTAGLSSALEREDDALLTILAGAANGRGALAAARSMTDRALARLQDSTLDGLRSTALVSQTSIDSYRRGVDDLVDAPGQDPLSRYQREINPLLRQAVAHAATARAQRLQAARAATALARDEVTRARGVVVLITTAALIVAAVVALRLARHVILPMQQLASAAGMIRDGKFETTVRIGAADEIGRVSDAFNDMARRLAEFHRSKLGEVLQAKRELEATMRALPDAVVLIDARGQIVSTNPEAERLFTSGGHALPPTTTQLIARLEPMSDSIREALLDHEPFDRVGLELAIQLECRGETRKFIPRIVPLASDDDQGGVVLVLSDVTQLARLDEMRMEVVAVASHELRTPLTTLRMTLLMLAEIADRLETRPRELIQTALGGVDLLSKTVDELLDLTRLEAGRLRLDTDSIDIASIVGEATRHARPRAEELGIHLVVRVPSASPGVVVGDRARLRVVIDNIINNALKYTPDGGIISVEVTCLPNGAASPAALSVSVADSGGGIPPEFRARVFEKFFRVEHHRPRPEGGPRGSGIGLYLCKQIVELHGGTIHCEAREDGPGTRVVFVIPAARPTIA